MLVLRIYSLGINVYIEKEPDADTYQIISGDDEGHEGRIASGITTIKELYKVLEEHFEQEDFDV